MTVSVLTSTIPQREEMLGEAVRSVLAQTHPVAQHLIAVDRDGRGAGPMLNRLLPRAEGDWLVVLDDDDLLDPDHVEVVLSAADGADVVYTQPRVEGAEFHNYEHDFSPELLQRICCVSHTALVRTELVREVGGWEAVRTFDWNLWKTLAAAGARFRRVDQTTWTYRIHGDNWSRGGLL